MSLAAIITILALAFEPFFQQIVVYPERSVPSGISLVWAASGFVQQGSSRTDSGSRIVLDPPLTLAMDTAFLTKNEASIPAPSTCPTGNCTWPTYTSLGICHRCQDVSSLLQRQPCDNRVTLKMPYSSTSRSNACGFKLNNTFLVGTSGDRKTQVTSLTTFIAHTNQTLQSNSTYWNSTAFANVSMPILDFYIAYMPGGPAEVLRNSTPVLLVCLLSWCIKSLQSSHYGGSLHDMVAETSAIQPDELPAPINNYYEHPDVTITASDKRTFIISNNSTSLMRSKVQDALVQFVEQDSRYEFQQSLDLWDFHQRAPYDINPYLANATRTISNSLRSREDGTTAINGTAWVKEQYVAVRWAWLALPVVLLFGTFALVCATIIKSRKNDAPAWKSSALATLLHGLTEDARNQFPPALCPSEIEAVSQKLQVKLALDNGDLRIGLL